MIMKKNLLYGYILVIKHFLCYLMISVAQDDVVNWDEHELNDISDETHNDDSHETGLQDFGVLLLIWPSALVKEIAAILVELGEIVNDALRFFFLLLWWHVFFIFYF